MESNQACYLVTLIFQIHLFLKSKIHILPKSDQQEVAAVPEETIAATVKKGKKANITKKISIDKSVACPVKKGEKVGMIHIYDGKKKIASYPLVSDRDAEKAGFMTLYIRMIKNLV